MQIIKRDGRVVQYEGDKIKRAIEKAMHETHNKINRSVVDNIEATVKRNLQEGKIENHVESIQDMVETELMKHDKMEAVAKSYILYRAERKKDRNQPNKYRFLSKEFLKPYKHKKDAFPTELGRMVYKRTYSRPIPSEGRREEWWETVARVVEFSTLLEIQARQRQGQIISEAKIQELTQIAESMYEHMFNLGLFPSGRSLWVGGTEPAYLYPLSNFNCSFITIDNFQKFSEMFFVLMLGTL